jgi:UDP-perosamine 4-acetyltransferase
MENKIIYALGVGHNTPVFIDLALSSGYIINGLYHYNSDRTGEIDHGYDIIGSFEDLFNQNSLEGKSFLLTMGDTKIKEDLTKKIIAKGGKVPSIIHPSAVISKFATISPIGVYISAFTHVQADTVIKEGTILLSGVNISHTNTIGKYCFVAGGGTIGAYTNVEDYVFVGQGALTISGKVNTIGKNAFIGAGSLVTKSVEANTKVAGRPAKQINKYFRKINEHIRLSWKNQ